MYKSRNSKKIAKKVQNSLATHQLNHATSLPPPTVLPPPHIHTDSLLPLKKKENLIKVAPDWKVRACCKFFRTNQPWRAAIVAEWLRRLTRNQIPSGSAGSNPADCETIFILSAFPSLLNFLCCQNLDYRPLTPSSQQSGWPSGLRREI